MKRTGKLLAVVAIVGLLMLATTATVFAEHPEFPPVPEPAHDVSCEGQVGAFDKASGAGAPDRAGLGDKLTEVCPEQRPPPA